jgi:FKBP-type peptidyl-prolyl cis-trans isomerase FklB
MKIKQMLVLCTIVTLVSCGKSAITGTKISNANDSLSYAIGVNIFNSLKPDSIYLNPAAVAKAMYESAAGKGKMDDKVARGYILSFMNARQRVKQLKEAAINKLKYKELIMQGDSFLQKNKQSPGVVVTASGLQYKVVKMGTGPKPVATDVVKVHYTGTLINGTKFDSSVDRGQPAQFVLNGVIKGWVEGLQLMPIGSKFILYIPAELGYGATQASELIKPYSTLIFEVELLDIVKK